MQDVGELATVTFKYKSKAPIYQKESHALDALRFLINTEYPFAKGGNVLSAERKEDDCEKDAFECNGTMVLKFLDLLHKSHKKKLEKIARILERYARQHLGEQIIYTVTGH